MNFSIDTVISEANKRHSLRGKTIGEDITLPEVAAAILQAYVDEVRGNVEDCLGGESKNFKQLGQLALLNRTENLLQSAANE